MLSKHGKKRVKSRATNSCRLIKKAIEDGTDISKFDGELRSYLDLKKDKNLKNIIIVYNQKIFVFSDRLILITVLNIPGRLITSFNKQISKLSKIA